MFIRHLSYFVTLAREMHFARAAEACHISQPTLSAAIRKLEEDLEFRLVVRAHRFLGLTAEGERVLAWAQQMLNDYDGLRIDLSGLRCGLTGSLRLGVIPAAMPLVSCVTARFSSAHPAATFEVTSMTSRAIQKGLDAFELDAGVTYLDNKPAIHCRRWQTRSSPAHAAPTLRMDSPRWRGKTDQPRLSIVQKISLDKSNV